MNAVWRLYALIRKELQALLRDPHSRQLLIAPVLMQLLLFPFAATLEVRNVGVVLMNEDVGAHGDEILKRIEAAPTFSDLIVVHSHRDFERAIVTQRALLGVKIDREFSRNLETGSSAAIQAIMDGRKSNSSQIALGYVRSIVSGYVAERTGAEHGSLSVRHLYNPNLDYKWFIVPQLIAVITALGFLVVTALSVAREREQGTFDQVRVSPLSPAQLMTGKAVPAILIALVQGTIILVGAVFGYQIPLNGSVWAIYGGMLCYGFSQVGCGLLISTACRTQQQAVLAVFSFLVPGLLLSGFVSPVENMPQWLQLITWANPMRHLVALMQVAYLKDPTWEVFVDSVTPMLLIAAVTLCLAYFKFRSASE